MKIEKINKGFEPITITLENYNEYKRFVDALMGCPVCPHGCPSSISQWLANLADQVIKEADL